MSRGTVFALCLSQAAITIGVIFYYPPIHVETYTCQPEVANGTLAKGVLSPVKPTTTSLVIPFMALSCLGALFLHDFRWPYGTGDFSAGCSIYL